MRDSAVANSSSFDRRLGDSANFALVGLVVAGIAYEHFPVFGVLLAVVSASVSAIVIWMRIASYSKAVAVEAVSAGGASKDELDLHASLMGDVHSSAVGVDGRVFPRKDGRDDIGVTKAGRDFDDTIIVSFYGDKEEDLLKEYVHYSITKGVLTAAPFSREALVGCQVFGRPRKSLSFEGKSRPAELAFARRPSKWSGVLFANAECLPAR
jgi:hypothetical protein